MPAPVGTQMSLRNSDSSSFALMTLPHNVEILNESGDEISKFARLSENVRNLFICCVGLQDFKCFVKTLLYSNSNVHFNSGYTQTKNTVHVPTTLKSVSSLL